MNYAFIGEELVLTVVLCFLSQKGELKFNISFSDKHLNAVKLVLDLGTGKSCFGRTKTQQPLSEFAL